MAAPLVVFGFPSYGIVRSEWVMALRGLQVPLGAATMDMWLNDPPDKASISDKRNAIAKQALALGARYVFYLGDDTIVPSHTILKLMQTAQMRKAKVVTGVYTSRSYPPQPMIWRGWMEGSYYDWHVGEVFPVDWAGCDCLLVDTDVFRAVPEPWFSQDYVFGPDQVKPISLSTEDVYFYEKVRSHGFQPLCDAGIICVHQDRGTGQSFTIPPDWPQLVPGSEIPNAPSPDYVIADMGAGTVSPFPPKGARLVRFDIDENVQPDVRCDLRSIPEPDCKFDEVWSRHVLEHFLMAEAPQLIQEWSRVLKIGGTLKINVPNFEMAIKAILSGPPNVSEYNWWQVYGQQASPYDLHHNGFTQRSLYRLAEVAWGTDPVHGVDAEGLSSVGPGCFGEIKVEAVGGHLENLQLTATKIRHPVPAVLGPDGERGNVWGVREPLPTGEAAPASGLPDTPHQTGGTDEVQTTQDHAQAARH